MRRTALAIVALLLFGCGAGGREPTSSPAAPTPMAATPTNIAGNYAIAVTASSICILRSAARTRTYSAIVTQSGADFQTALKGSFPFGYQFFGSVNGASVTGFVAIAEPLAGGIAGGDVLSITGNLQAAVSGTVITGTLNGAFNDSLSGVSCNATNHQIVFTRQ